MLATAAAGGSSVMSRLEGWQHYQLRIGLGEQH